MEAESGNCLGQNHKNNWSTAIIIQPKTTQIYGIKAYQV